MGCDFKVLKLKLDIIELQIERKKSCQRKKLILLKGAIAFSICLKGEIEKSLGNCNITIHDIQKPFCMRKSHTSA